MQKAYTTEKNLGEWMLDWLNLRSKEECVHYQHEMQQNCCICIHIRTMQIVK